MDEKSNEELLDELIRRARLSVGKLTKGEACAGEYAAVLARMAGPGEVVCRLPPGYQMGADGQIEKTARPNNGGNDDQGK